MRLPLFLAFSSLLCALFQATPNEPSDVDFERDIRPIIEAHCASCHGAEKQKSGLRLDRRKDALAGGYSGEVGIVPFDSGTSELIRRIASHDEDERMPPSDEALDADAIALLAQWIDEGAAWGEPASKGDSGGDVAGEVEHWAYFAPVRPEAPSALDGPTSSTHVVDRFLAPRLHAAGIEFAPVADPVTLLRRLSLDLTGLPPTIDEIDAFAARTANDPDAAWSREIDRLLASPHFGERWARHWLDLARYSDSGGGGYDTERSIWPYRDWVIRAFNDDMPFDRFTIEQLAGDLLPDATRDQLVATGFHRNTMIQEEGGADDEEYRIEAVKNRVETTGTVWLGSTLICAQCHDHKYDPFTMRDYYGIYDYFNQTQDGGRSNEPKLDLPTPDQELEVARLDAELEEIDHALTTVTPELAAKRGEWERDYLAGQESWSVVVPERVESAGGSDLSVDDDGAVLSTGKLPAIEGYTVVARTTLDRITGVRLEVLKDARVENNGSGRGYRGNFVLTGFRVRINGEPVTLAGVESDYASEQWPAAKILDGNDQTGWGIHGRAGKDHETIFRLEKPFVPAAGDGAEVTFELDHGVGLSLVLGHFRLALTGAARVPAPTPFLFDLEAIVRKSGAERTPDEQRNLDEHYLSVAPALVPLREERERLIAGRPAPATTLVMRAVENRRASHIQLRGDFLHLGERVEASTPAFLPRTPPAARDRLELARWLVDRGNPLTARVTVNRMWQRLFGRGLVATENDFGTRSDPPNQPELLDWLAVEFMESGWSTKALLRLLLTSRAYRQSSEPRPELDTLVDGHGLFARQARPRLEAEAIRDSALVAAGLLDGTIGGPSVYPPLPDFVSVRTFRKEWPESDGADRYRRTLYTWHWRTSPHPFLTTFDAPDATTACTRRSEANNALQALVMANDPMIFEVAQGLGTRALEEGGANDDERLARAFRWCVGRVPTAAERETLARFLASQRAHFASDPEQALAAAPPSSDDPAESAAWTAVARVLLNLDEFVTRG